MAFSFGTEKSFLPFCDGTATDRANTHCLHFLCHKHIRPFYLFIGLHQCRNHILNFFQKSIAVIFSTLNHEQLFFPVSGHGWRLNLFRHHGYQSGSFMGGNQVLGFLITFTFQKTDSYQLFNRSSTSRRCPQSLALRIFRHFICTGSFHTLQKGVFCKMLGR